MISVFLFKKFCQILLQTHTDATAFTLYYIFYALVTPKQSFFGD